MPKSIAILGEYSPEFEPHTTTDTAIAHSSAKLGVELSSVWITTDEIDENLFDTHAAIWVAPGSPYKNIDKTLWAIRQARENGLPCFGTCGGFQHMVIEYARGVLGFNDAQHAEYDPFASSLFVSELECSLAGRAMQLQFVAGSRTANIYNDLSAEEQYYCKFGVNPAHVARLAAGPLVVAGSDAEGEVRVIELSNHPFFIGTLFVPQMRSTPAEPHPLVTEFVRIVARQADAYPIAI